MGEFVARGDGLRVFGLSLSVEGAPPPGAWETRPLSEPSLQLRVVKPEAITSCWSGRAATGWEAVIDGAPFAVEQGLVGDYLFVHGERAVHHLSADGTLLRSAPSDPTEPSWWRLVLDSVLFTVALLKGRQALHAAAVVTPAGAVAITAPSGGGKSTLLAELLRRGLPLLADDIVVLEPHVLLDRRRGAVSGLERTSRTLGALVASLLRYPQIPERERARFEFASVLSACVPIMRLTADPMTSPSALGALLAAEPALQIREDLAS